MRCQEVLFEGVGFEDRSVKVPYPLGSGQMVNVAPIRTRTRRTYDAPHTEFSREGDHTPYVIRKRLASASQAEVFKNFLERAGKDSGLFESIKVKSYGRGPLAPFELQVVLGKTALALDNVGYGVSQVLPILVEMFTRPKGTLLTIQQPEVHLHPKAQATLGDLVAQLAREEDKRFLIETHSDFAIDRFRLNVRGGGPIPSQLLFFERTANGNVATPIKIGDAGELPEDQPSSYREFFFNESLALLS
jgi:predicted ATPase